MARSTPGKRVQLGAALVLLVLLSLLWAVRYGPIGAWAYHRHFGPPWLRSPHPGAPTVVFIVVDTVRSDHLSLCGYERPTTPFLEELVAAGAAHTCEAQAPGSWTLPSHASFFTGVDPVLHHAHSITSGVTTVKGSGARARKLNEDLPTLAEAMGDRGYQTVALSANPVVSKEMGLLRGFDRTHVAKDWGDMMDGDLVPVLEGMLQKEVNPGRPLFLFVNIADAHQPLLPVPSGVGWVKARPRLKYGKLSEKDEWRRFVEGRMSPTEADALLSWVRDSYDYGVWRADRNTRATVEAVQQSGWCTAGCRFVVVSDHGEMIGEHGLLDHGNYVWESLVHVPLLTWSTTGPTAPLPRVINAVHAYHLVRDGVLPEVLAPVTSMAWPHLRRCALTDGKAFCGTSVKIREGDEALVWTDGEVARYRLDEDPDETNPLPLDGDPRLPALQALGDRVLADERDDDVEPDVIEALRAAGYLE